MLIRWTDKFDTGIRTIDEQHKKLIELINEFAAAPREHGHEAKLRLLSGAADYARYHFQVEEALMRRHGFAAATAHESEHRRFEEKMAEYKGRTTDGRLLLSLELTNYLRDWLQEHILSVDQHLAAHLRKLGVS